jgi:hypothetical protein
MAPWNRPGGTAERPDGRGASLAQLIERFVLGENMVLPLDALTHRIAVFAARGGAKTNPAAVLLEELVADQMPVVILDPAGVWFGLSLATDGNAHGLPVAVLGGPHAGLEVRAHSGATVADFAVQLQRPIVVDLSSLAPRCTTRFVADFVNQVLARGPRSIHLVVAEADVVASDAGADEGALAALLAAADTAGVGMTWIGERPAAVSPRILDGLDAVVIGRLTAADDRATVRSWLRTRAAAVDVRRVHDTLSALDPDEAWLCSPRWLGVVERFTLRNRATYDAARNGRTPLRPPQSRASAVELARLRARCIPLAEPSRPERALAYGRAQSEAGVARRATEPAQHAPPKRRRGRPVEDLVLTAAERSILQRYTKHAQSAPQLAMRARIVLECAEGRLNGAVARDLGISIQMVGRWRRRFLQEGLRGLEGSPSRM